MLTTIHTHAIPETVTARWALSFKFLWKLVNNRVIEGPASVSLLQGDAATVRDFNFPTAPGMSVLVYCWNRGLTSEIYKHVVDAAAHSSQVIGEIVWL